MATATLQCNNRLLKVNQIIISRCCTCSIKYTYMYSTCTCTCTLKIYDTISLHLFLYYCAIYIILVHIIFNLLYTAHCCCCCYCCCCYYYYVVYYRGEEGEVTSKKEFIQTTRMIAKESEEVVKMARKVASACTDKRMATVRIMILYTFEHHTSNHSLLVCFYFDVILYHNLTKIIQFFFQILNQTLESIPTIATQLKIIAAVKASRQGGDGMLMMILALYRYITIAM